MPVWVNTGSMNEYLQALWLQIWL